MRLKPVLAVVLLAAAAPWVWSAAVTAWAAGRTYALADVPPRRVALVFGAAIYRSGALSAMLEDRVETAVRLYEAGKVERLLVSGDNRFVEYNEPGRMGDYAVARGVPAGSIQPDYGGRSTYDSCYRARHIFGLREAIVVSQGFHLPRALFTCRAVGLDAVGVAADIQPYRSASHRWSRAREIPALAAALLDLARRRPAEVLGDPIPIP